MTDENTTGAEAAPAAPAPAAEPASNEPASLESILENSMATVEAKYDGQDDDGAAKPEETPAPAEAAKPELNEDGTPKEVDPNAAVVEDPNAPQPIAAPDRFSDEAKAAWETAPEPVKQAVEQMHRELENGIEKYKQQLAPYEGLEQYAEMAKTGGTDLKTAMAHYAGLENLLSQDPIAGFQQIATNLGFDLRGIAQHVLGQNYNPQAIQQSQQLIAAQQEAEALKLQLKNFETGATEKTDSEMQSEIDSFAKDNPHFETVRDDMAKIVQSGLADTLQDAYSYACSAKGLKIESAADKAAAEAAKKKATLAAQTQKGQLSIDGAPNAGSEPGAKKRSNSTREALELAMSQTG